MALWLYGLMGSVGIERLEYTAPTRFRFLDEPLAINRVSGQGRCPGRPCHGVSGQGRRPGQRLGLGFVLAFRVEKQNIGSSRNRNPVGTVYSIRPLYAITQNNKPFTLT